MRVCEPREDLLLEIFKKDAKGAKKKDPCNCVVAKALKRIPGVLAAQVHAHITNVVFRNRVCRYLTGKTLRQGLKNFDDHGTWDLEEGMHRLQAIPESQKLKKIRKRAKLRALRGDVNKTTSYFKKKKKKIDSRTIENLALAKLEAKQRTIFAK